MTKSPKIFPFFKVGDTVRKIEWGPKAELRTVEAVGDQDHTLGYIKVSGLIGWHSARGFAKASREMP